MVGYAFARLHPELTSSVLLMEMLLPGIEPANAPELRVPLWHGGLHMVPADGARRVGVRVATTPQLAVYSAAK